MLGPPKGRDLNRSFLASLETLVPADHFYRRLDAQLDLSFVREWVKDCYAPTGRPSIDPVTFFRLQLVLFFEGLRSERELMRVAADRLSIRWYLGFGLDEPLPDHSSLTRIRNRYGLEIFRRFFDAIVEQGEQAGLVWGKELYFDATKVQANASVDRLAPRFAVEAHLEALFSEQGAAAEGNASKDADDRIPDPVPLLTGLPPEHLDELAESNQTRHDWIAQAGQQNRAVIGRDYRRMADFKASSIDPDASLMPSFGVGSRLGYHVHYGVDGGKARIIRTVLVTPLDVMENQPMLDLLWRTCFRWRTFPDQVTGDTTYGTIENIVALERAGIRAYVPLPDFSMRTEFYGLNRFTYDTVRDVFLCPQGEKLRRVALIKSTQMVRYRADAETCLACPLRSECTASKVGRQVERSVYGEYADRVRNYHDTPAYQKAMRKRKVWLEPLFGEAKQWHGLRRFRLRRLQKVNIEGLLMASGQNLKRLLSRRGWGRRRWPGGAPGLYVSGPVVVQLSL